MQGHQHHVGGGQRIDRQQAERRRTVDDDIVVFVADILENGLEFALASEGLDQLDFGTDQVRGRRQNMQVFEVGFHQYLVGRGLTEQGMVDRDLQGLLVQTDAAAGVALRIHVHQQRPLFGDRQGSGEIDGGRRLADSALLIGDGHDMSHDPSLSRSCAEAERLAQQCRD